MSLKILNAKDVATDPIPPVQWVIEPLFAMENRILVYGEWGSFKSWFLLYIAMHMAAGEDLWGKYTIDQPYPVLYLDEEMAETTLRRRVKQLMNGLGWPPEKLENLRLLNRQGINIYSQGGVNHILKQVMETGFQPRVFIMETLRAFIVGEENNAGPIGDFWNALRPWYTTGNTVLASHHMRKPRPDSRGESSRHRASGNTAVMSWLDSALALSYAPKSRLVLCENVKARDDENQADFRFRLEASLDKETVKLIHCYTEDDAIRDFITANTGTSMKELWDTKFEEINTKLSIQSYSTFQRKCQPFHQG